MITEMNESPYTYQQSDPPLIISLPESMDNFDFDQISHIVIKLIPIHELVHREINSQYCVHDPEGTYITKSISNKKLKFQHSLIIGSSRMFFNRTASTFW
jgi:hypothetical protein